MRTIGTSILAFLMLAHAASAADVGPLYRGTVTVTGREEPNRLVGFARTLAIVLTKVTGDPRLPATAAASALLADPAPFVAGYSYRDLMAGIPVHDEQGSRERPYALTVSFDPAKIDAAIASLGAKPWTGVRPEVPVFLTVRPGGEPYVLLAAGEHGRDLRDSLAAASERLGIPLILPQSAPAGPPDNALTGALSWDDRALGWTADWRFAWGGTVHRWRIEKVGFDDALRSGAAGTVQLLSGNGEP
ncbi:MAG TPA: DUF2066 domain-containing protein [Bauldia sp.]|nr:DUF2066 domain-containing protein [Bauldia sp.]